MANTPAWGSIDRLINQSSNFYKRAALRKRAEEEMGAGMESSVPDDPTGDGTADRSEGEYSKMNDESIQDNPFVEVTAADPEFVNEGEPTDNTGNVGTDVTSVLDPLVDDYNTEVPDYGTDTPVKTSALKYASLNFEQNKAAYVKIATLLVKDMRERAAMYGNRQKTAAARPQAPVNYAPQYQQLGPAEQAYDNLRKWNLIKDAAIKDAALVAKNMAYVRNKMASGEDIGPEDVPVDTLSDTLGAVATPEEAAAIESLPEETLEALVQAPEPQLEMLAELAQEVDAGNIEPEEAIAAITGEPCEGCETDSSDSDDSDDPDNSDDSDSASDEDIEKQAAAFRFLMKRAEEEAPISEEDLAAAQDVSPEDIEAINSLSPSEIEDLIALESAVENGDVPPEVALAAIEGDPAVVDALSDAAPAEADVVDAVPAEEVSAPISDDEAASEFSSAMAEEGVTPDDLDAIAENAEPVKAAKLRKISAYVRSHRAKKAAYHRSKTARSAALRQRCRSVLHELTN